MTCPTPITLTLEKPDKWTGRKTRPVPCGKCGACQTSRRNEWTFRIKQEYEVSENGYFVTFTYSDENLKYGSTSQPILVKKDFQDFMKRLREYQARHTKTKIRYYCVGEYGTNTKRPHYHALLFNLHESALNEIDRLWGEGHTYVAKVNDATIHYVTKYHVNRDIRKNEDAPEFTLMSTRPGIGYAYIERVRNWHLDNKATYVMNNGHKGRMPRYYKDKIFSEHEKYRLSLETQKNVDKAEIETYEAFVRLGYENPIQMITENALEEAKRYLQKNPRSKPDLF